MLTTNQKHTIDSQKQERKEHKHGTKKKKSLNHKKRTEQTHKTRKKMSINTYQSIISLYINGLNAGVKRYQMADCI